MWGRYLNSSCDTSTYSGSNGYFSVMLPLCTWRRSLVWILLEVDANWFYATVSRDSFLCFFIPEQKSKCRVITIGSVTPASFTGSAALPLIVHVFCILHCPVLPAIQSIRLEHFVALKSYPIGHDSHLAIIHTTVTDELIAERLIGLQCA